MERNINNTVAGKQYWMKFLFAHDIPYNTVMNNTVKEKIKEKQTQVFKNKLQTNSLCIVEWLLNAHLTLNYRDMTAVLKKLERFKDIPIQVKDIVFKLEPSSRNIKKTDKNATIVAGIVTSQDPAIRKQVARGCKTIWNVRKAQKAIKRPLGMNLC